MERLRKYRIAWHDRRDTINCTIKSVRIQFDDMAADLKRARRAGKKKEIQRLERRQRVFEKYHQRLKADLERANWIKVRKDVAEFILEVLPKRGKSRKI